MSGNISFICSLEGIPDHMKISIEETNQVIELKQQDNVYESLKQEGVSIPAICGGKGTCGKCKIKILEGNVSELTIDEERLLTKQEIIEGYRLACRIKATGDLRIQIVNSMNNPAQIEHSLEVERKALLMKLPVWFTKLNYNDLRSSGNINTAYGVSFDIGTTTIVGALWNLDTWELVDVCAEANPQRIVGADVISRIEYCLASEGNEKKLHDMLHERLNDMLCQFYKTIDYTANKRICIVGNTAMSSIAQNLPVKQLITPPFPNSYYETKEYIGEESGLRVAKNTNVSYLPGIGGHVGSDITAVMLATDLVNQKKTTIAIDIGTNGEIVLLKEGNMVACSTAAGPAFEGACIQHGMRADTGAIDEVTLDDEVILHIINSDEAQGICGSGLIDAIAAMLDKGIIDETGRIRTLSEAIRVGVPKNLATRIQQTPTGTCFVLQYRYAKEPIVITQEDIRQVQLAKAAIRAGIHMLMNHMSVNTEDEIEQVYLAGAFGSYLRVSSARRIGLLPESKLSQVLSVGNAAGIGASMVVLKEEYFKKALYIAKETKQLELSQQDGFQQEFIECINFS